MRSQVKIEAAAHDVLAQITAGISLFDGGVDDFQDVAIFAADVDISAMRAHGTAGDDNAFDELVRNHLHQRAVLAGARFALVRVAENIFRLGGLFGDETPLYSRRKASAAAPAQI